ncbi:TRAM domain-containing protein [Candidatus Woesearchaeota archaeon]|nr:TRAM domain-containing protein [Candidatus Woesearchaeota archaeon]
MYQKREFGFGGNRGGGFGGGRPQFRSTAPVKEGDELDVTIEAVGSKGDGIAKKDGFILFVPGVKQGDRVRIRITKVLSKVGFAEVAGQAQSAAEPGSTQSSQELPDTPQESQEEPAKDSENFGEETPVESTEETAEGAPEGASETDEDSSEENAEEGEEE